MLNVETGNGEHAPENSASRSSTTATVKRKAAHSPTTTYRHEDALHVCFRALNVSGASGNAMVVGCSRHRPANTAAHRDPRYRRCSGLNVDLHCEPSAGHARPRRMRPERAGTVNDCGAIGMDHSSPKRVVASTAALRLRERVPYPQNCFWQSTTREAGVLPRQPLQISCAKSQLAQPPKSATLH
jgi:hypothetical protein